ncbi:MAG: hypothetical protein ACI97B_003043 [Verrucomicrobiales bacterium]|jgi:hypothetical protein
MLMKNYLLPFILLSQWTLFAAPVGQEIRFNRDVRGILSDKCFACHGPDAKTVEGNLRLDLREDAIAPRKDGDPAIVPGDPAKSEVIYRIFTDDEDDLMPPTKAHKPLEPHEREVLKRWIEQGAGYEEHWAYTPLKQPVAPPVRDKTWAVNPIDQFVLKRLSTEGLKPSPEADRITLIRRVSFDLTGLPPTLDEVDAFVKDRSPDAYEKLVDRLLASPRYGERMAIYWLDLVRYADTVGYHGDQNVSQSPYRDYVIRAFNHNMPYDQFMREQLAGDLLPDATLEQQIASGYNRLNQTTEEGGSQAKEYLAIYFADRVRNASQVFMGATIGCAQCHDHKYDPYTARDFYSFGAFFADLEERGVYGARKRPPEIQVPNPESQAKMVELDQQIAAVQADLQTTRTRLLPDQAAWEKHTLSTVDDAREVETVLLDDRHETGGQTSGAFNFVSADKGPVHSGEKSRRQQAGDLVQHYFDDAKAPVNVAKDMRFFTWVYLDPKDPPKAIMLQFNDGDWNHRAVWGGDDISYGRRPKSYAAYQRQGGLPKAGEWFRLEVDPATVGLTAAKKVKGIAFTQFGGLVHWDKTGWIGVAGIPADVADALAVAPDKRNEQQTALVRERYLNTAEPVVALNKKIAGIEAQKANMNDGGLTTVVSKAVKPREIRILPRGNWMDDSGEVVQPAIPAFLGKLDTGDRRATRLDFANWLGKPDNVLSSRTLVNRLWYLTFGRGICTSVDDFGGQGTFPSYPDLLDWLAVDFVNAGWDIKHTMRTIVTSATYRQTSKPSPALRANDPYNDLFARQGRFGLAAEMIRDNALATSGLLVEKIGGPSAKPYQPAGYYAQLNFPGRKYQADTGLNQYRRGVYTHWQRTFLHPMLKAFDAPSREECTAARARSNTPLQALSLLNDPSFVEAARVLAARIMREGGTDPDARIQWAYRTAVSRTPESAVASEIKHLYDAHLAHYKNNLADANMLVAEGDAPAAKDLDPAELAAWTSVARVILNLHETITRY